MIGVGVIGIVGVIDLGVTGVGVISVGVIPISCIDPPSTNGSHGCASIANPTNHGHGHGHGHCPVTVTVNRRWRDGGWGLVGRVCNGVWHFQHFVPIPT